MSDKQKPVVTFGRVAGFGGEDRGVSAKLGEICGHPRLGDSPVVYTSRIERIDYAEDGNISEIETRNTIYRRR